MEASNAADIKQGITDLWKNLQCPICLDVMITPVSTKCDHLFCKFCMMKLLENTKQKKADCPVCKAKITKRSLQESPGFQRLVSGLQHMIQAYEHDRSLNDVSGISHQKQQSVVIDAEATKHPHSVSSGDIADTELDNVKNVIHDDPPASHSSTVAAQHGFARLMGFENSSPLTTENEGLDSGLGDALPALENKMSCSTPDYLESLETEFSEVAEKVTSAHKTRGKKSVTPSENALSSPSLTPDEEQHQPLRKSSRKKKIKKHSEPDNILNQKQKKSLEKVAEWLMKVPLTEDSVESEKIMRGSFDSNDSDSGSSTSTVDVRKHTGDMNPKGAERAEALEDQVFGAVYKRKRRGRQTTSLSLNHFVKPQTQCPSKEIHPKKVSKWRKKSNLKNCEQLQMTEQVDNISNSVLNETQQKVTELDDEMNIINKEEELKSLPENNNNNDNDEVVCAVSDTEPNQPKRKSKKMHNTLHMVDSDLANAKSESTGKKKTDKKKGKNRLKSVRMSKPLDLVGVQNGEYSSDEVPKIKPEEVQVHIENYPSSEDQGTPAMRSIRRSRRLQHFTAEVQESHRKARAPANAQIAGEGSSLVKQSEEVNSCTLDDDKTSHKNGNMKNAANKNGCVYDQDVEGIENLESHDRTATEAITAVKESIAGVPNVETASEASKSCCVPVVLNSTSPTTATLTDPAALESNSPKALFPITAHLENAHLETSACENKCTEMEKEEDKNDSELDTEQLLRSFKATKRKSFHLGGPKVKRSHCSFDEENLQDIEVEENCHVGSRFESAVNQINTKETDITKQEVLKDTENSCCSDLIPPSYLSVLNKQKYRLNPEKALKEMAVEKSDQVVDGSMPDSSWSVEDGAGNCISSALSPNKVSKRAKESPHRSAVPQVVDSGLRFTGIGLSEGEECEELPSHHCQIAESQLDCTRSDSGKMKHIEDNILMDNSATATKYCSVNTVEPLANAEFSLTPSGLVTPAVKMINEATVSSRGGGKLSAHSPIKSGTRKRRRAQRIESSSESDSSGAKEELPTLSQILRASAWPSAVSPGVLAEDEERSDKANQREGACVTADAEEQLSHPPACHSPDCMNSSQVSVDLFGTPKECHAPVNDTSVSMESSQFSSEILVTQQKMEMQKELVRLEKLMALVSEVLQEKEDDSASKATSEIHQSRETTGHDSHRLPPCDQGTDETSGMKAVPGAGRDPSRGAPDGEGLTQAYLPKHGGVAEMALQSSIQTGLNVNSSTASKTVAKPASKILIDCGSPSDDPDDKENNVGPATLAQIPQKDGSKAKLVLVSSGLGPSEQVMVKRFAKRICARVVSHVTAEVTHVIMRTDAQLVCERTLKYFLGIAGRKWVLSFNWISECFKQKKLLDESLFEVRGDVVNGSNHQGPMRARTTIDNNLLMKGYKICFQGRFTDMTTDEMEWMVELCGATVVKDPLLLDGKQKSHQLVIVQPGPESSYNSLFRQATVVTRGWLLDTVATYTLQNHNNYTA
ncbi:hypothetical protein LDENG_00103060 [Lucifuga dentata]|nr:hypothetical protein LDENG_00103060 [Lucifuga dentata]